MCLGITSSSDTLSAPSFELVASRDLKERHECGASFKACAPVRMLPISMQQRFSVDSQGHTVCWVLYPSSR